jgi:hypothetical protein
MIARRKPLRRSAKPLKRTRLSPVSKKRAKEMRTYSKLRKECLEKQPICEVWLHETGWVCIRHKDVFQDALYQRDIVFGIEQAPAWVLTEEKGAPQATEIHHREKRGANYLNVSTFMCVCRENHERIENNKSWAREMGFLK